MNARSGCTGIDDGFAERLVYEATLGNHLHEHPWVIDHSNRMSTACLRYLRERCLRGDENFADGLVKVAAPIDIPFAGRVQNVAVLYRVLSGHGLVREQQCAIWRVFNQVIATDLVGARRRSDALEIAERAGFDPAFLQQWVQEAIHYASVGSGEQARLEQLDPRYDFLRLDWHPIRLLQNQTRLVFSPLHQHQRYWSLRAREAHRALGGRFSENEARLISPLGPGYLPWMDTRRFLRANYQACLVQQATSTGLPSVTGISGVGMHTHQFAKAMAINDVVSTRLVAVAYLLPLLQHSIYEIWVSEMPHAPSVLPQFSYQELLPVAYPAFERGMFDARTRRALER